MASAAGDGRAGERRCFGGPVGANGVGPADSSARGEPEGLGEQGCCGK